MVKVFILFILSMTVLTSCGDLLSKKKAETEFSQFSTCEMDTEAISEIFTRNIKGELFCLESNLNLFIDVVKTDRPGFLSRKELVAYAKKNIEGMDGETIKALEGVFVVNSLLFGDDPNYISRTHLSSLIKILKEVNQQMVANKIFEFFTTNEKMSFYEHKKRKGIVYKTFLSLGKTFADYTVENSRRVRIFSFLSYFENKDNSSALKYIKSVLFIKKALLGGDDEYLSGPEVLRLTKIVGDLGKVVFDFINIKNTKNGSYDDEEIIKLLKEGVESVKKNFYFAETPHKVIFTFDDLVRVGTDFFPEYRYLFRYRKEILLLKKIMIGNDSPSFTASDVNSILGDLLEKNLGRGILFYRAYDENKNLLDGTSSVDSKKLNITTVGLRDNDFKGTFNRIVQSYKYIRSKNYSSKYSYGYKRDARGMFEISLFEQVIEKFLKYFGSPSRAVGGYSLTLEQFEIMLLSFVDFLEGEGLTAVGQTKNTASTVTLISTLFLSQSNGDGVIDLAELTEFAVTGLSGLSLGKSTFDELTNYCNVDGSDQMTAKCYRENFKHVFSSVKSNGIIAEKAPELKKFLGGLSPKSYLEYMTNIETFARTCTHFRDGREVPMSSGDSLVLWTAMGTTEQTMLRFDTNRDGLLKGQELENVYGVFKNAVKGLMPKWLSGTSKDLFYYLIYYKQIPVEGDSKSKWRKLREGFKFIWHLGRQRVKKVKPVADRITFTTILKLVSENTPNDTPFDCELLR